MSTLTLTARWVFPVDRPPLERGLVTIAGQRIVAVEEAGTRAADVDLGDAAIIPGLVNAHAHLDLSGARGRCPPSPDFVDWLRQVMAYRQGRTAEQVAADIRTGMRESLAAGVTLLGDISYEGWSRPILNEGPGRAVAFFEMRGLTESRVENSLAQAKAWLAEPANDQVRPGISPHAPYSVHRRLFAEACRLARMHHLPLAAHLAETPAELELLSRRSGPFVGFLQALDAWEPAGLIDRPEEWISSFGDIDALIVHGNYLNPAVVTSPRSTLIYCPRTHAAFGHPPHPFRAFLKRGVRVALGTDGLASNPDLDILAEARFVHQRYPDLADDVLLGMITLSGAEVLGWADEVGSLTRGKSADLVVLPLVATRSIFEGAQKITRVMLRGQWME